MTGKHSFIDRPDGINGGRTETQNLSPNVYRSQDDEESNNRLSTQSPNVYRTPEDEELNNGQSGHEEAESISLVVQELFMEYLSF